MKKPPPAPKPTPSFPLVKALYDYDATDTDELSFRENDVLELLKEGKCIISNYVLYSEVIIIRTQI